MHHSAVQIGHKVYAEVLSNLYVSHGQWQQDTLLR